MPSVCLNYHVIKVQLPHLVTVRCHHEGHLYPIELNAPPLVPEGHLYPIELTPPPPGICNLAVPIINIICALFNRGILSKMTNDIRNAAVGQHTDKSVVMK